MATATGADHAETLNFFLPFGWLHIDARAERTKELDRIARELTDTAPRDSAPVARKRIESRMTALLASLEAEEGFALHSVLFPKASAIGLTLPISVAVGAVQPPPDDTRLTPTEILVGMAMARPGSVPVAVDDTVALRSHEIESIGKAVVEELSEIAEDDRDAPESVPDIQTLRVRYLFGWREPRPAWYLVMASALMPGGEDTEKLAAEYLGLFDPLVAAIRRTAPQGA